MPNDPLELRHFNTLVGQYSQEYIQEKANRLFFALDLSKRLRLDTNSKCRYKTEHIYVHSRFPLSRLSWFYTTAAADRQRKEEAAVEAILDALTKDLGSKEAANYVLKQSQTDEYPGFTLLSLFRTHVVAKDYVEVHNARLHNARLHNAGLHNAELAQTSANSLLGKGGKSQDRRKTESRAAYYGKNGSLTNEPVSLETSHNEKKSGAIGKQLSKSQQRSQEQLSSLQPADSRRTNAKKARHARDKFTQSSAKSRRAVENEFGQTSPFAGKFRKDSHQDPHHSAQDLAHARASSPLVVQVPSSSEEINTALTHLRELDEELASAATPKTTMQKQWALIDVLGPLLASKDHVRQDEDVRKAAQNLLERHESAIGKTADSIGNQKDKRRYNAFWNLIRQNVIEQSSGGGGKSDGAKTPSGDAAQQAAQDEDPVGELQQPADPVDHTVWLLERLDKVIKKDIGIEDPANLAEQQSLIKQLEIRLMNKAVCNNRDVRRWLDKLDYSTWLDIRNFARKNPFTDAQTSHYNNLLLIITTASRIGDLSYKLGRLRTHEDDVQDTKDIEATEDILFKLDRLISLSIEDVNSGRWKVELAQKVKEFQALMRNRQMLNNQALRLHLVRYHQKIQGLRASIPKKKQKSYATLSAHLGTIIDALWVVLPIQQERPKKAPKEGAKETQVKKNDAAPPTKAAPNVAWEQEMRQDKVRTALAYLTSVENSIDESIKENRLKRPVKDDIHRLKSLLKDDDITKDGQIQQTLHALIGTAYSAIRNSAQERGIGIGQRRLYFALAGCLADWFGGVSDPIDGRLEELKRTLRQEFDAGQFARYDLLDRTTLERMLVNRLAGADRDLRKLGDDAYPPDAKDRALLEKYRKTSQRRGLDQKAAKEIAALARRLMAWAEGGEPEAYGAFGKSCWDILLVADSFAESPSGSARIGDAHPVGAESG